MAARYCGLLVAMFAFSTPVLAATVSLRADVWYPMNGTPGSDKPGYMVEIAQRIFSAAGHKVDYATMPWERTLLMVRNGDFDCAIGAYKEDAPDFVFPEEPLGMDQTFFYVKKGESWRYAGLDSLKGQSLGLIGGYAYDEEFTQYIEKHAQAINVQTINADNALEQNIKKLLAGRVKVVLESPAVMQAKLAEMKLADQVEEAGALTEPIPMYIACSPAKASSAEYAKLLGDGVRKLRASGELKTILDKYGLKDWQ